MKNVQPTSIQYCNLNIFKSQVIYYPSDGHKLYYNKDKINSITVVQHNETNRKRESVVILIIRILCCVENREFEKKLRTC